MYWLCACTQLREQLRGYVEARHAVAVVTGVPVLTPMWFHFPDPDAWTPAAETQFMFGADWLVAPVTSYGAASRSVYLPVLPAGEGWVSFYDGVNATAVPGGQWVVVPTPLETFPLFVRSSLDLAAWGVARPQRGAH